MRREVMLKTIQFTRSLISFKLRVFVIISSSSITTAITDKTNRSNAVFNSHGAHDAHCLIVVVLGINLFDRRDESNDSTFSSIRNVDIDALISVFLHGLTLARPIRQATIAIKILLVD